MSASGNSVRVIVVALLANLGIAIAKFVGAAITGSASLLAEAIHSLVDSTNQVLLLVGSKRSQRPPTALHPLGYGREAFFWSFIVAVMLFTLGGLFAIYEGAHKISHPEAMSSPMVGLGILLVAIVLEGYSFYACWKEVKARNTTGSLWRWLRKTTSSELLVIFTEDAAALAGLIIATVCLTMALVTGDPSWDAIGSIVVGVVLVVVAVFLAIEIKSLIIGEAPAVDYRAYLDSRVGEVIPGAKVLRFISLQLGADEVMLSYKVSPGSVREVGELVSVINRLEVDVKAKFPEVRWQFVEPDNEP